MAGGGGMGGVGRSAAKKALREKYNDLPPESWETESFGDDDLGWTGSPDNLPPPPDNSAGFDDFPGRDLPFQQAAGLDSLPSAAGVSYAFRNAPVVIGRRTCVGVSGLRRRTGSTIAVADGTRRQRRWSAPSVSVVMSRCQSRMGGMVCALGIRWGLVLTASIDELRRHQQGRS